MIDKKKQPTKKIYFLLLIFVSFSCLTFAEKDTSNAQISQLEAIKRQLKTVNADKQHTVYGFDVKTIEGAPTSLKNYEGQVLLIVNTASKCALTPQLKTLDNLYSKYKNQGFSVLAFPCNQLANQEPNSNKNIVALYQERFGVSFPIFAKINVNGDNTHPLFKHLKEKAPGFLNTENIIWNFTKFLVSRNGKVIKRFSSISNPQSAARDIEAQLKQHALPRMPHKS